MFENYSYMTGGDIAVTDDSDVLTKVTISHKLYGQHEEKSNIRVLPFFMIRAVSVDLSRYLTRIGKTWAGV